MVKQGKTYLESLLKPIDPGYQCDVFRAANWSVSPSENVVKTLEKNFRDQKIFLWNVVNFLKKPLFRQVIGTMYLMASQSLIWEANQPTLC